ncbi:MAG: hypothetical protein SOU51_04275 [Collinsella sp.]|nr:hypothetical protein [Collinsella sp.]
MRYVTEGELRDEYAACPFETYRLAPDTRLTPGARQFLVDFRIAFDAGIPRPQAGTGASESDGQRMYDSFLDDVRVLGAKLCLLARRSSGISRGLSCACHAAGAAWGQGGPGGVVLDAEADEPACVPAPATDLHPIYFEAALLDAELVRAMHFWTGAKAGLAAEARDRMEIWVHEAQRVRNEIARAIAKAQEEVEHG